MSFSGTHVRAIVLSVSLFISAATVEGQTKFVDAAAAGLNDGTSWANAYVDLQAAIGASVSGDQIWVAAGLYKPAVAGSPTSSTFLIPDGVVLYGGLAGGEDPNTFDLTTRDFVTNETMLSGDLSGDDPANLVDVLDCRIAPFGGPLPAECTPFDTGAFASTIVEAELNMDDNTRHVVTILNSGTTTRIDGFTITAGSAESGSNPLRFGGGLYNDAGSPTVANCKFSGNYGQFGGGIMSFGASQLVVDRCLFVGNVGSSGGGIYKTSAGAPTLTVTNSIFRDNSAHFGGGIQLDNKGSVTNSVFVGNKAVSVNAGTGFGGGIYVFSGQNDLPTVTNCSFNLNSAGLTGGAIRTVITGFFCNFELKNSILWDNGDEFVDACGSIIENCDIQGSGGGGVGNIDLDPQFADTDLRLSCASPCVDAGNNLATSATTDLDGNPRIANGTIDMGAYEGGIGTADPVITCPVDVVVDCADSTDPLNTGQATAFDGCSGGAVPAANISFADVVVAGCGTEQTITRTWTADTGSGNPSSCIQTVSTVDSDAPTLTCPADIAVSGGFGGRAVSYSLSATDTCDANPSVAATPMSGSFFPTGVTSVSATATDACANTSAACSFDVAVSCFGINRAKIGTKDQVCRGIESIEFTSMSGTEELISLFKAEEDSGGAEEDTLPASIVVGDGVNVAVTVDTSCGVAIQIGDVYGPYTVSDIDQDYDDLPDDRGNDIQLRGTFVPATPFDLSVDDLDISIDDGQGNVASFTIPAGSFVSDGNPSKGKFKFKGNVGTADVKVKLKGCKVDFKAKNATNTGALIGTAMTIRLTVGPNTGEDTLAMENKGNHLKFKRKPKVNCCPSCHGVASMQVTSDQGVLVFVPDSGKTKLNSNTVVDDGVNGAVTIHTSCSQPIAVGDVFGAYTISEVIKIYDH